MDDRIFNNVYSLNEAILHVNLAGQSNLELKLDHRRHRDERHTYPANQFVAHVNADLIAISVDGMHWIKLTDLDESFVGRVFPLDAALQAAEAAAASKDRSDVRIKFQQFDNVKYIQDGRSFDNVHVYCVIPPTPRDVPWHEPFEEGLPDEAAGWEYYSTNEGRITVVDGQMRMDDSTSNKIYSLNEAIAHLDLRGLDNLQLQFDHCNHRDERNEYRQDQFTGHVNADLIAISVDGIHWVKLTDLDGSFTGRTLSLDAALSLAETAANSSDRSDVRIKFQQYDNHPVSVDGRSFDNIQVYGVIPPTPQKLPQFETFANGRPNGDRGWEYSSTGEGRIAVVDGQLQMDDAVVKRTYSLNEATFHVDLTGQTNLELRLDHVNHGDERHGYAQDQFTGRVNADLIAVSVDGVHWVKLADLDGNFTGRVFALDEALAAAEIAAGSDDRSDVRIKLQQYDNCPDGFDGRSFDNLQIYPVIPPSPQDLPVFESFAGSLPAGSAGWEYYSNHEGRIANVTGQLRMDDAIGNRIYSLNEAILHVNLEGHANVQLTFDHVRHLDERHAFPSSSFIGRVDADMVALSLDGIHWVKIMDLDRSFLNQSFSLDAALHLAETQAGSSDRSDVRIKFQQYDNYPYGLDGRSFDNVRIQTAAGVPTASPAAYVTSVRQTSPDPYLGWQNPLLPEDVNGSGSVTPQDALLLLNRINWHDEEYALAMHHTTTDTFYDVNGDNLCTAVDVLMVINYLNAGRTDAGASEVSESDWPLLFAPAAAGEGEWSTPAQLDCSSAVQELFAAAPDTAWCTAATQDREDRTLSAIAETDEVNDEDAWLDVVLAEVPLGDLAIDVARASNC